MKSQGYTLDFTEKSFHQGGFQAGSNLSPLFGKIATLLKAWYTRYFFVKIFFLRQLAFDIYSEKNMWRSLFIERVAVCTLQASNFTKKTRSQTFSRKIFKVSPIIIFHNIFICVEESNFTKDYQLKVKRDVMINVRHLPFSH